MTGWLIKKVLNKMNSKEAIKILKSLSWNFSKKTPETPHSYARKRECLDKNKFLEVAIHITTNGLRGKFGRSSYIYFYTDTHKYWVMDKNPRYSKLINRAELDG